MAVRQMFVPGKRTVDGFGFPHEKRAYSLRFAGQPGGRILPAPDSLCSRISYARLLSENVRHLAIQSVKTGNW